MCAVATLAMHLLPPLPHALQETKSTMAPKNAKKTEVKFQGTAVQGKVHEKLQSWFLEKFKGSAETGEEGIHPEQWFTENYGTRPDTLQMTMKVLAHGFLRSRP